MLFSLLACVIPASHAARQGAGPTEKLTLSSLKITLFFSQSQFPELAFYLAVKAPVRCKGAVSFMWPVVYECVVQQVWLKLVYAVW